MHEEEWKENKVWAIWLVRIGCMTKVFDLREVVKMLILRFYISKGSCTHSYSTQKSALDQIFLVNNYTLTMPKKRLYFATYHFLIIDMLFVNVLLFWQPLNIFQKYFSFLKILYIYLDFIIIREISIKLHYFQVLAYASLPNIGQWFQWDLNAIYYTPLLVSGGHS